MDDMCIIDMAYNDNYIIITNDKDFGELVFHRGKPHKGVILLRLDDERATNKIKVLGKVLESYSDRLSGNFVVATEYNIRIAEGKGYSVHCG